MELKVPLSKYPLVDKLKEGGTFWLNLPWSDIESIEKYVHASLRRKLAEKKATFYVNDASKIVADHGLPGKISTIVQSNFFQITGLLGSDYRHVTDNWIDNEFNRLGQSIIDKNKKVAHAGIISLIKIEISDSWLNATDAPNQFKYKTKSSYIDNQPPPYIKENFLKQIATAAGSIPVSTFHYNKDGVSSVGATKYLKKGLSTFLNRPFVIDAAFNSSVNSTFYKELHAASSRKGNVNFANAALLMKTIKQISNAIINVKRFR